MTYKQHGRVPGIDAFSRYDGAHDSPSSFVGGNSYACVHELRNGMGLTLYNACNICIFKMSGQCSLRENNRGIWSYFKIRENEGKKCSVAVICICSAPTLHSYLSLRGTVSMWLVYKDKQWQTSHFFFLPKPRAYLPAQGLLFDLHVALLLFVPFRTQRRKKNKVG